MTPPNSSDNSLAVSLGRLKLQNPVLVASGTFGYAKEMSAFVDFTQLGGIIPKTVTTEPRIGNAPPRTCEVTSGLLNSIGLDNDGLEHFMQHHVPYLAGLGTSVIANIAGKSIPEFEAMAARVAQDERIAGIELNISCPNVSGGVDFGTNPKMAKELVTAVRNACDLPIIAKLTPNVTSVVEIADAAKAGGCDAVSLVNTFQGMAIDWRNRKPRLGNILGGLSGPAIKPLALRIVWQVASQVDVPIIGVGGIQNVDDVMEFVVAGASAVQIGTANFYNPSLSGMLVKELEEIVANQSCNNLSELVGTLDTTRPSPQA